MEKQHPTVAIVGGTGALGTGLALRWAAAGFPVLIGSRSAESARKAAEVACETLASRGQSGSLSGYENSEAAAKGDIVVITVPFSQYRSVLETIGASVKGKLVLDTTVPLVPPKVGTVQLPETDSAAVLTQQLLGDDVRVVSAFHTVAADKLQSGAGMEGDVLVFGKRAHCDEVLPLVQATGMRGFFAGPLANSTAAEALTSVMITINRQFKCHAGIQIVGAG